MIFHIYPDVFFNCNIRIIFILVKENSDRRYPLLCRSIFCALSDRQVAGVRGDSQTNSREV